MNPEDLEKIAKELSKNHVDWFLKLLKPLLTTYMEHGFKHGVKFQEKYNKTITTGLPE